MNKRLKAKSAQEGLVLTEAQLVALAKAKDLLLLDSATKLTVLVHRR